MASSQDQVIWSIFGTFWAANAVLLVALFATGSPPTSFTVGRVVTGAGFVLSLAWHLIQGRALGHLLRFENLVEKLEERLHIAPELSISGHRNEVDYKNYVSGLPARVVMKFCSAGATILWFLAALFYSLCSSPAA
jgi:hypothetical protein